jgi:hypothetical protein
MRARQVLREEHVELDSLRERSGALKESGASIPDNVGRFFGRGAPPARPSTVGPAC